MGAADVDHGDRDLLRRLRVRAGLSQKELAGRADLSVRALRNLESGDVARPHAGSIRRLADALDVDAETLAAALCGEQQGISVSGSVLAPAADDSANQLRVNVLGPLVVRHGETAVDVTSAMQRTLLGLLAIQYGKAVGAGEIVDLLWPSDPPRTCLQLVHTYIGQLRRLLEPERQDQNRSETARAPERIRRSGGGYALELEPEQLDLAEFDASVTQARQAWSAGSVQSARQFSSEAWACWRGPLLAGSDARLHQHPAAIALAQRRTEAVLEWADIAFGLAAYDEVISPLRVLRADEPLHEGLAARLMLALAGDGQQAAALSLFDEVRERLDEQLGVTPGAELKAAHLRVLRGRLPASARPERRSAPAADSAPPAQLPADIDAFTGRGAQLDTLDAFVPAQGARVGPARVVAVVGMGGAGKTALVVHWAHGVRDHFPDGQLYVNLRGYSGEAPLRPLDALAGFLVALGVPGDQVPEDEAQAAAVYRSRTAGRRLLVVLDNASEAEQVRPLLPTGPGSLALVTARDRMTGLIARDGARLVPLDALAPHESAALLDQMLGPRRAAGEPDAVHHLARLCAHLPLALRIAAANLAARPRHRVADYNAKLLAGDRLGALEADGDAASAVRATFELSCNALPAVERRMFRLLGTAPGPDIGLETAAALAGLAPHEADRALDRLTGRHLVQELAAGRYSMHDLVHLYAAELAAAEETEETAGSAMDRLAAHYRAHVAAAAHLLYPHVLFLPAPDAPGGGAAPSGLFADVPDARAWFDGEFANLVALVRELAATGRNAAAYGLSDLMTGYFVLRAGTVEWRYVAEAAHAAAVADGDLTALAATELSLAMVDQFAGRHEAAAVRHARCAEIAERAGWIQCQAVGLNNLARGHWTAGRAAETITTLTAALELHRRSGRAAGEAVTLANLGAANLDRSRDPELEPEVRRGCLGRAMGFFIEAMEVHRRIGDTRNEADTLRLLAEAHRDKGELDVAFEKAGTALELARAAEDVRFEINVLNLLGTVQIQRGRPAPGLEHHARAHDLARMVGDPRLNAETHLALADSYTRLGREDEAILLIEDARELGRQIRSTPLERQCRRALDALGDLSGAGVGQASASASVSTATTVR
ncbi:MAG TPA: BTAD domain-containing putative transcriptional regulator [Actinocrinis sp.]|nr:BTAD domain-containing putative transcriptional regulator [Actinocrinis sp.]